ncbi:MAG: PIN domain-containing protein [Acidimicrobiales bacterium]|nr:PIN domain-containing protein [Acidimicrobiales bacterium]
MNRTFVDASVLVRLFDDDEPNRQAGARALVGVTGGPALVVSGLVLAEFVGTVTTRMSRPLSAVVARRALTEMAALTVVPIDASLVLAAADTASESGLSVRDALALEAAVVGGCDRLATEALSHGSIMRGIHIIDPSMIEGGAGETAGRL